MSKQLAIALSKIALLFLVFSLQQARAQRKYDNLYFICGHPFEDITQQYDAWLLKYNPDSIALSKVKRLSNDKQLLKFINVYEERNKIIVLKDDWYFGNNKYMTIINTEAPINDTTITLLDLDYTLIDSKLVKRDNQQSVICLDIADNKSDESLFLGVNIGNLKQAELQAEAFSNSYIIGGTGGAIQNEDYMMVYTSPDSGQLRIPKASKDEERPTFEIVLPEKFYGQQDGSRKLILLNTDELFVFKNKSSDVSNKEIGDAEIIIYQKSKNTWGTLKIKGNRSSMRGFAANIAGVVQSTDVLIGKDAKGKQKITKFERVSPGKRFRRKASAPTGAPADDRFYFSSIYSPGILYLYNTLTEVYIEWNTGQGDSEILLVENNTVYYRVNDEIYEAVVEGKKLGKAQLLIKHEMVPDIHWAFKTK